MSMELNLDECNAVLEQYEWQGTPRIIPGPSGMNNTTLIVEDDCRKTVVRLYSSHADRLKLQFEHEMLSKLEHAHLSIATPTLILNKEKSTITTTDSGRLAAAFHFIEGDRPSVENMKAMISMAKAAAELSEAFSRVSIAVKPAYSPYYELEINYPPLDHSMLLDLLSHEQLVDLEDKLLNIQRARIELEQLKLQFQKLPHQWIHGDLNCSNSLVADDAIVALLDFEFVTYDLRAMELAVLLSEMISPETEQLQHKLNVMLQAFQERVQLSSQEVALLPQLIKLRSVDVVMHFVNRFKEGLDHPHILRRVVEDAHHVLCIMNEIKLSIA